MARKTQINRNRWQLSFGFFAGPALWGLEILAGYGLVSVACTIRNKLPVYALAILSGLIVLAAAILAYRAWNAQSTDSILLETDQAQETPAFWAVSGFFVSTLFFLLILVTFVTALFLSPCPIITMILP